MANNPISMIKIRQILRLQSQGCSKLQIAAQTGIARNTLKKYLEAFNQCAFSYSQLIELSDPELEDLFVKLVEDRISCGVHLTIDMHRDDLGRMGLDLLKELENRRGLSRAGRAQA